MSSSYHLIQLLQKKVGTLTVSTPTTPFSRSDSRIRPKQLLNNSTMQAAQQFDNAIIQPFNSAVVVDFFAYWRILTVPTPTTPF